MKRLIILLALFPITYSTLAAQSSEELIKKWNISAYIYWGFFFDPEEEEQNDYIQFYRDGTFKSSEKGNIENGTWSWKRNQSILFAKSEW
ncbi:MAG: hypothetical protein AAGC88_07330 [Bacteroidota bacterium]